jgi:hydroxypyruvate isomerase
MFKEVPFLDRFALAANAGFRAVEFLLPYEYPASEIEERLRKHQLVNVVFNLPPGDWAAGERGLACLPGREGEFRTSVDTALSYALGLGTRRLHAMAGIAPPNSDSNKLRMTLVENLRYAAEVLAKHRITLMVEAINIRDVPGYFLNTQAESHAICIAIGAANVKMQMDMYHMQIVEGDIATKLRRYASFCGHVQIAGVPERNEPNIGEVNYPYLFQVLDETGFDGWIGCEYHPVASTQDGLGWIKPWLAD